MAHTCFFSLELPSYSCREVSAGNRRAGRAVPGGKAVCRCAVVFAMGPTRFGFGGCDVLLVDTAAGGRCPTSVRGSQEVLCSESACCRCYLPKVDIRPPYFSLCVLFEARSRLPMCRSVVPGKRLYVLGRLCFVVGCCRRRVWCCFAVTAPPPGPDRRVGAGGETQVRDLQLPSGGRGRDQHRVQRRGPGLGRRPVMRRRERQGVRELADGCKPPAST